MIKSILIIISIASLILFFFIPFPKNIPKQSCLELLQSKSRSEYWQHETGEVICWFKVYDGLISGTDCEWKED